MAQNSIDNKIVNATLTRTLSSSGQWDSYADGTDTFGFYNNAGTPESAVAADIGSICTDTTNGALYIKTTDTANTGWSQLVTSTSSSGEIVQVAYAETATAQDITAGIPLDNTIPQISEGTQIMTVSITPTNSSNNLLIKFDGFVSFNSGGSAGGTIALFRDATANALIARQIGGSTNSLCIRVSAASTSSTTFQVRGGVDGGTGGNVYVNRNSSTASLYSTTSISTMTVFEIQA